MTIFSLVTVLNIFLAFLGGVYFAKWMGDRRQTRREQSASTPWYREVCR